METRTQDILTLFDRAIPYANAIINTHHDTGEESEEFISAVLPCLIMMLLRLHTVDNLPMSEYDAITRTIFTNCETFLAHPVTQEQFREQNAK